MNQLLRHKTPTNRYPKSQIKTRRYKFCCCRPKSTFSEFVSWSEERENGVEGDDNFIDRWIYWRLLLCKSGSSMHILDDSARLHLSPARREPGGSWLLADWRWAFARAKRQHRRQLRLHQQQLPPYSQFLQIFQLATHSSVWKFILLDLTMVGSRESNLFGSSQLE